MGRPFEGPPLDDRNSGICADQEACVTALLGDTTGTIDRTETAKNDRLSISRLGPRAPRPFTMRGGGLDCGGGSFIQHGPHQCGQAQHRFTRALIRNAVCTIGESQLLQ